MDALSYIFLFRYADTSREDVMKAASFFYFLESQWKLDLK